MAQTPTAFDTTVLVDLDSDNGMKYKMPRHGPHTPWSQIRNRRNGDHARRPSPPSDLEDSDDALAGNVQSGATATLLVGASFYMKPEYLTIAISNLNLNFPPLIVHR